MLYQRLRARTFQNCLGPKPTFPLEAEVIFSFSPPWAFGISDGGSMSRAAFCNVNPKTGKREGATIHVDKHRGRGWSTSPDRLLPLQVCLRGPGQEYRLQGSELTMTAQVASLDDLGVMIRRVYYWLPVYLNLDFGDPPTILSVVCSMGTSSAIWAPQMSTGTIFPGDQSTQTGFVENALARVLFETTAEPRLLAALEYFYSATRLITLGETPGEFLAEAILNFAKILEVLFGAFKGKTDGSMDKARAGLASLGYGKEEIDDAFIPAIALRNSLGVGHPGLTLIPPQDLEAVHWYADSAESHFRDLLRSVVALPPAKRAFLSAKASSVDKSLSKLLGHVRGARQRAASRQARVTIKETPVPIAPKSKYE